ncbi:MAG: hypothetical protein QM845_13960, partial [Verrucomicrobiota bacterium]|nr:hypothetical protein [Verrucomicrobiota bacterium]
IGLLTDSQGEPVSIQVYRGNTNDLKTFSQQVHKIKKLVLPATVPEAQVTVGTRKKINHVRKPLEK